MQHRLIALTLGCALTGCQSAVLPLSNGDAGGELPSTIANGYGKVTTILSDFLQPSGVAVDSAGNVYIANTPRSEVVRVSRSGTIARVGSGFAFPQGVATDSSGNVYVADTLHSEIKRVAADGKISTVGSGFSGPAGVAVDGPGNVYVADTGNRAVK